MPYQSTNILQNPYIDESDRGLINCIGKFFYSLDSIQKAATLAKKLFYTFYLMGFL